MAGAACTGEAQGACLGPAGPQRQLGLVPEKGSDPKQGFFPVCSVRQTDLTQEVALTLAVTEKASSGFGPENHPFPLPVSSLGPHGWVETRPGWESLLLAKRSRSWASADMEP